jgi:hypothetical protein
MSPFAGGDINLRLTAFFANEETAGSLLRSFIYLDARDLTFVANPDGTHQATFDLSTVMFGDNGKVLDRQDRSATLRLSGEAFERSQREGVVYSFDTALKKYGAFQFRVAVRDQPSARIGSAGQFVAVPNLRREPLVLSGIVIHKDRQQRSTDDKAQPDDRDIASGPAVRQFHQGVELIAVYAVYNAIDKTTAPPQLTTQTRIFRDGKLLFSGNPTPLNFEGQADLQRLIAGSRLLVTPEFSPGDYVLQIIVEAHFGKEKIRRATQWIDFEVVK